MKLTLEPRYHTSLDGFADMDEVTNPQASELMKKVSKDKANLYGLGTEEDFRDYLGASIIHEEE